MKIFCFYSTEYKNQVQGSTESSHLIHLWPWIQTDLQTFCSLKFSLSWMLLPWQDGGCRRSEVGEEDVDPLLWERHVHHVPGSAQRVRPSVGGIGQRGEWRKHTHAKVKFKTKCNNQTKRCLVPHFQKQLQLWKRFIISCDAEDELGLKMKSYSLFKTM